MDPIDRARQFYSNTAAFRSNFWAGYALGCAASGLALITRLLVGPAFEGYPFLTFFPAVVLTAFIAGWRAGVLAAALGGLFSWYFLIQPYNTLALIWPQTYIALGFYIFTVTVIILLTAGMQRSFTDLEASNAAREQLNRDLEKRVAERTAELEAANSELVKEAQSRAQAEAQLRQLQKMEAIGQLTGGVAHDFNNMLAIVIGSLDLGKRHLTTNPERAERSINNALEGARRAAELTARLLAFSRRQPLDPVPLEVNKLVLGMSEMLRRTIGETIAIETILAGGLWTTFVDPPQLSSAIVNLFVNARDAMPDGGRLTIETSNAHLDDAYAAGNVDVTPGQYVVVAVTDSGTGMAPEIIQRAFDPFFTTKGTGKGTGLGLSQVYGFVKQSGGHVKIYSEIGHGTTVKIYLPRYRGAERALSVAAAEEGAPLAGRPDTVIMVVEDDERVREVSVDALTDLGYTVIRTTSPSHALSILDSDERVDLLFTDVVMPDMSGRRLADLARAKRPGLKVLYTTGYTQNAIVHNGVLDPGVAFLPKPFTVAQLAAKVRRTLE